MNYIFKLKNSLRIGRGYIVMILHKVVVFSATFSTGKVLYHFFCGGGSKRESLLKTERKKKEKILTCNNAITAGFPLNKNEITKKIEMPLDDKKFLE